MVPEKARKGWGMIVTGGYLYRHGESEYWLVYTADAYFTLNNEYGADFFQKIRPTTSEAYEIALGCVCVLAEEGELCRRYMGYDAHDIPTVDELRRTILPDGIAPLKEAVINAVMAGLRIDVPGKAGEDDVVDIGLLEYEKKTVVRAGKTF